MGAWVPVEYRPDDVIVMRRNPYYWKVDDKGNQLPYLDEFSYRLSTWADRDVQAVAGTGDFSNLEQAESYVEALKRSADPAAPARLAFGARTIGYSLQVNLSGNGWGEPDARGSGDSRAQPQHRLPQGAHLRGRPSASRRLSREGPVHRHLSWRAVCGHGLLRQGVDHLLSVLDRQRQGRTREGRTEGHRRQRHRQLPRRHSRRRRQGCRSDTACQCRLPDRQEAWPKAWSRRWNRSASG